MKIKSAEFRCSAPELRSCPAWSAPEFALIGRSNVGKSSLVNLLTGRRELAKVSATPGKTKLINFFLIDGAWSLVDLPGYGYAKVGRETRLDFERVIATYLTERPNLRRVFVLIDSRLEPQLIDREFVDWLREAGVPFSLVFTKADKQSPTKTRATIAAFLQALAFGSSPPPVFTTSITTGAGRNEILASVVAELASRGDGE